MTRYFITGQDLSISCGRLTLTMISKPEEHLWLLYTTRPPVILPRRDRRLNNTVPHQNNHTLWIDHVLEQEEPGRTIFHTWHFDWPGDATTIWFYSINMGSGPTKATRSAIFAYELQATAAAGETWSNNGLPDLPWEYDSAPPTSPPSFRPGVATLFGSAAYTPLLRLNLEPYLGITPDSFCDQYISIKLGGFLGYGPNTQFELATYVEFRNALNQTMSRNIYYDAPVPPCNMGYTNLVGLSVPNSTVTFNLQSAYDNTIGVCNAGMDPQIPAAWPWRLTIYFQCGWPGQTTEIWNGTLGSVFIGSRSGLLKDISPYWRSKRLQPKLT